MYPVLNHHYELRLHPSKQGTIRKKGTHLNAQLNETATEILTQCNGTTSTQTIIKRLAHNHSDTIDHVNMLITTFLHQARDQGYVKFHKHPVQHNGSTVGSTTYFSPSHASIELTYQCNLKCKHCYANASTTTAKRLSLPEAKQILRSLQKIGVATITLSGGEPTIHPQFLQILKYASQRFERIQILSNGWKITEVFAQNLQPYKDKLIVQISVDGMNEKTHDYIRGRQGSFKRACNAISVLSKQHISCTAAMLITRFNLPQIEQTFLLTQRLGAEGFRIGRTTSTGRAKLKHWELTQKEFKKAGETICRLSKQYGNNVYVESWEDIITGVHPTITESTQQHNTRSNCGAGHRVINITPAGDVTPCSLFTKKQFILGIIILMVYMLYFATWLKMALTHGFWQPGD